MSLNFLSVVFSARLLPFLYALIGFGLLITVHEIGHFLFCKIFGIHTPTFSIGMGPTLYKRKVGTTNFRLAMIPIGGYVEIAGMAEIGQGKQAHSKAVGATSFRSKPYWQKFLVLTGGIFFNLLFAYVVFSSLYFWGMPVQKEVALVVSNVKKNGKYIDKDLRIGDRIISINEKTLALEPRKLFSQIKRISKKLIEKRSKSMSVFIERDKKKLFLIIPIDKEAKKVGRGLIGGTSLDLKPLRIDYERYSFVEAIKKGIRKTNDWIYQVLRSLKMLFTERNIKDFGGPVMIVSESFKMAQRGLTLLLVFMAIISINLAIINLLPIGALDGGQLLFETIEAIIRRKIPEVIRFSINLASWLLILGLILYLSFQDIAAIFFS
jgi:regulator of sigma E protease